MFRAYVHVRTDQGRTGSSTTRNLFRRRTTNRTTLSASFCIPPVQGVRIELMIDNLVEAAQALKERGVIDDAPFGEPWGVENFMRTCVLTSPSGIRVSLLGQVALAAGEEGGEWR